MSRSEPFFGWRVVAAAFFMGTFGWGLGIYAPPILLHVIHEAEGWPVAQISTAITLHFLVGALVTATLPALYRRWGVPAITKVSAFLLAAGFVAWSMAVAPWQIFVAACLSGAGWVGLGAAAVNAVLSPWFVRRRPAALAMAYNGASVGGVVLPPVLIAAIGLFGFPIAALVIGAVMLTVVWILAARFFALSPDDIGVRPDGDGLIQDEGLKAQQTMEPLTTSRLLCHGRFVTLSAASALGLFAQVGITTHLFSLLVLPLGAQTAGLAMGLATASGVAGRMLLVWLMPADADRRIVTCLSYGTQLLGSIAFLLSEGADIPLLIAGVVLFGAGTGNASSLPPLIAQKEFPKDDVLRAIAWVVAISQATYAFAPATFGLLRELTVDPSASAPSGMPQLFLAAAVIQLIAIATLLAGRRY